MKPSTDVASERTFTLFQHLPTELRLKIWSLMMEPRVVLISYNPATKRCDSSTPIPPVLHVNTEARYEALRFYRPLFKTHHSGAYVLFSPKRDTLYFPRHREMGYDDTLRDFSTYMADQSDLDHVQRIALDSVEIGVKRPWEAYDKAVLIKSFHHISQLYLVLERRPTWLSNLPRDFLGEKTKERNIKLVEYEDQTEAAKVGGDFEMQFVREEEMLKHIWRSEGQVYEPHTLPPVMVVEKRKMMRN